MVGNFDGDDGDGSWIESKLLGIVVIVYDWLRCYADRDGTGED